MSFGQIGNIYLGYTINNIIKFSLFFVFLFITVGIFNKNSIRIYFFNSQIVNNFFKNLLNYSVENNFILQNVNKKFIFICNNGICIIVKL